MAQFRRPNPYDPGFALPANVLAEPPGRGTLATVQLPRKTISGAPSGWDGGYVLPDYVRAEGAGRGAMHSHWARRKTIQRLVPDALGADGPPMRPGFPGDPIKAYGQRASEFIMGTIREVPVEFRQIALEALLNEIEPGLYDRVTKRANEYKDEGMSTKKAVGAALASSMSEGIAKEMIKIGTKGVPGVRSQLGLGFYGDPSAQLALAGIWSSIKSGASKVGGAVKTGVTKTGSALKTGAKKAYDWGKKAVNKLGSLACSVMKHPAAPVAAGAAAAAAGAPPQAGAAGAQVGAALCTKNTPEAPQDQLMQPQSYLPKWILPVAIGGGALVLVLMLTRK